MLNGFKISRRVVTKCLSVVAQSLAVADRLGIGSDDGLGFFLIAAVIGTGCQPCMLAAAGFNQAVCRVVNIAACRLDALVIVEYLVKGRIVNLGEIADRVIRMTQILQRLPGPFQLLTGATGRSGDRSRRCGHIVCINNSGALAFFVIVDIRDDGCRPEGLRQAYLDPLEEVRLVIGWLVDAAIRFSSAH